MGGPKGVDPTDPMNLILPNLDMLRGTIGSVVSEKLKEFAGTLTEPSVVGRDIAKELRDLNSIMRQLNVTLTTLSERLK